MAKKYYWLKLKADFFNSKEIKKLRKTAGGDTFVIIYLKMQLLSLQSDGKLYYDGIEDDFASEIALTLDEDAENVRLTVAFLQHCGLIECISEEEYFMSQVPEITGKECDSAQRVRNHRAKQALQCNSDVTKCNIEIEKEKDKELDSETETEAEKKAAAVVSHQSTTIQDVVNLYHKICVSLPKIRKLSTFSQQNVEKIIATYTEDEIRETFEKAEKSLFLKGKKNSSETKFKDWKASFEWLVQEEHFVNTLNGKYDNSEEDEKSLEYEQVYNSW